MYSITRNSPFLFFITFLFFIYPPECFPANQIILIESPKQNVPQIGAGGLSFKYKRATGPFGFDGDLVMWGLRGFGGKQSDPKLGLSGSYGVLNGNSLKLILKMIGFTLEGGFHPDPLFKWRATFGGGNYNLRSRTTFLSVNKGSFTFLEPMLVGVRPLTRHISIEVGVGYTFAGSQGVKIEGICLEANLLIGRFD